MIDGKKQTRVNHEYRVLFKSIHFATARSKKDTHQQKRGGGKKKESLPLKALSEEGKLGSGEGSSVRGQLLIGMNVRRIFIKKKKHPRKYQGRKKNRSPKGWQETENSGLAPRFGEFGSALG